MSRRRFLGSAAWLAAGAALGTIGCSSDVTPGSPESQAADNKQIADSAAANDKAARGNQTQRRRKR